MLKISALRAEMQSDSGGGRKEHGVVVGGKGLDDGSKAKETAWRN